MTSYFGPEVGYEHTGGVGARRHAPYAPQLWHRDREQAFDSKADENELKKAETAAWANAVDEIWHPQNAAAKPPPL